MALKLIAPGERGNTAFAARGRINGRLVEYSLKTTDQRTARRYLRELEARLLVEGPQPKGMATFAEAVERYKAFRQPSRRDERSLDALVALLGRRRLRDLTVADLHDAANRLKPGTTGATRNRAVLRPAAAAWHYAAEAGLCDNVKVKLFPEEETKAQAVEVDVAARLVAAAPEGPKRFLMLWLFHQGMRITHTLDVTWDRIDLARGTVAHRERKGRRQHDYVFPLHEEVLEELRRVPEAERTGRVFPWTSRSSVRWIGKLADGVGVRFTAHMARHSKGTWMNDQGAGLKTIMGALGHASERSSLRYQHENVEVVRAVGEKISLMRRV